MTNFVVFHNWLYWIDICDVVTKFKLCAMYGVMFDDASIDMRLFSRFV
jgi:hypothetical protein